MKHIYFIYGNQSFEIEEEVQKLTETLIPEENRKEAAFTFDIEDFFSKDQNQNKNVLSNFKNTCETVSFFSPVILVHLKNLQRIIAPKKRSDPLAKELEKINLVKIEINGEFEWVDADTLVKPPQTRYRFNGSQIAKYVKHKGSQAYSIILDDPWKNRLVMQQKGDEFQSVSINELFIQKLNREIDFVTDEHSPLINSDDSDELTTLLGQYLTNPPEQVEFILSAHIKNTRELNQKIYSLIKKHAVQIKKTIAYDDFRPVNWVIERAQKKQLQIDRTTADLMIEIAGSDYGTLAMELDKLSVLLAQGEKIEPETLLNSVSHSKSFTVFRITDSLVKKDLKSALECLQTLLGVQTGDYISVFALIASQFRKALKISWMVEQGMAEKMIIEHLGMNQWIAKQLIKQVKNFTTKELENLVVYLSKCDIQLKYSAKGTTTLLENICFLICQNEFRTIRTIKSRWLP